jgi:ABC-type polysaccharide/polyol phosphate export permease
MWPDWKVIVITLAVVAIIFMLGYFIFKRLEPRFAEEI